LGENTNERAWKGNACQDVVAFVSAFARLKMAWFVGEVDAFRKRLHFLVRILCSHPVVDI
jgi:hypothetical protein